MSECARVEERIVDSLAGELPREERAELEAHLASCAACRDTLRSYRAIQEAYRGVPEADASPAVAERILAASRARSRGPWRARRRLLAAAALVLAILVPVLYLSKGGDEGLEALVIRADALRDTGELRQAEAAYEEALAKAGDGVRAAEIQHRLAAVEVSEGAFERALPRLNALLARQPGYADRLDVLLLRGRVLEKLGLREQAIQAYLRVATEFPGEADEITRRVHELENTLTPVELESLRALGYAGGER